MPAAKTSRPTQAPMYSQEDLKRALSNAELALDNEQRMREGIVGPVTKLRGVFEAMFQAPASDVAPIQMLMWTEEIEDILNEFSALTTPLLQVDTPVDAPVDALEEGNGRSDA